MEQKSSNNVWWPILIVGILFIITGLLLIVWPVSTFLAILWILGIFLLVYGVVEIIISIVNVFRHKAWGLKVIDGIIALIVGILILEHPEVTSEVIFILIGIVFLIRGITNLFLIGDTAYASHKAFFVVSGVLDIVVAILLFCSPVFTGVILVWIIGLYTLISGAVSISLAISLRKPS